MNNSVVIVRTSIQLNEQKRFGEIHNFNDRRFFFEMSASATGSNMPDDDDCILLISDEDEEETSSKISNSKSHRHSSTDNRNSVDAFDRNDETDGRRFSRRRKNRDGDVVTRQEVTNDGGKTAANTQFNTSIPNDKKLNSSENRTETRSRKRERSPSPPPIEVKDADPLPYKDILPGVEGAAFQSR